MNFAWIEDPVPPIVEVEDRHVQHEHRIVRSPLPALENSSPAVAGPPPTTIYS